MKILLLCINFILFRSTLFSQDIAKVIVLDIETKAPIEFVDVKGENFFTYTNSEGIFEMPSSIDTLFVSHLAYEKKQIVSNFKVLDTIHLRREIMELNEVLVSADRINIGEYIEIDDNYPFKPFTETFFLRSILRKDGAIVKLQDLVGNLKRKQLFSTSSNPMPRRNLRFEILEMRKAAKNEEEVYFEMWSIETIAKVFTSIYKNPSIYDYKESSSRDSSLLKLAFASNSNHPYGGCNGYYLINKRDQAVSEFHVKEIYKSNDFTEGPGVRFRNNLLEIKVSFKKNENDSKYYMDKAKFNATVELYNGNQESPNIYEVEYIWLLQEILKKDISKKDQLKKDIFKLNHAYNESFWKENETLTLTREMNSFIEKLNKIHSITNKWKFMK